ncbi:MAG: TonB-dependent receptor, partial [Opitutaceae bacterium]|nr:TonB-dependent receptor [Opitutaceae bacterium]
LLDGKVFVRATRFSTTRAGAQGFVYGGTVDNPTVFSDRVLGQLATNGLITAAERERRRINSGGYTFDVASTGYEFSVTANPTKNWRLQANYSISNPVSDNIAPEIQAWAASEIPFYKRFDQNLLITSVGTTLAAEIARWELANQVNRSVEGVGTAGTRKEKVSAVTRYAFSEGRLRGLHVGATVRHQGKQVIAYSTSRQQVIYGNSFTRADAFLGYTFGRAVPLKFLRGLGLQLNVQNVFDDHEPLSTRVADPNAARLDVNRMAPQLPLTWRLSADVTF